MKLVFALVLGWTAVTAVAEEEALDKTIASRLGSLGLGAFQRDFKTSDSAQTDQGTIPSLTVGITLDNPTEPWLAWGQFVLGLGNSNYSGTTPAGARVGGNGFGIYLMPEGQIAYRLLPGSTFELQVYGGIYSANGYRKAGGEYWVLETNSGLKAGLRLAAVFGNLRMALAGGPNLSLFATAAHYPSDILFSASFTYRPAPGFDLELPIDYQFTDSNYGLRVMPWFKCLARGTSFASKFSTISGTQEVSLPSDRLYLYGVTLAGTTSF